jgi:hypothetical protein
MAEMTKRVFKPKLETKVRREDFQRVQEIARAENKTKSEVVRDAVLWYLDHREELANEPKETAYAQAVNAMTNRVCAMLARQGRLMGTLFELTYANMSQTRDGKAAFEAAANTAKQKMAKSVDKDERDLVEVLKKKVKEEKA